MHQPIKVIQIIEPKTNVFREVARAERKLPNLGRNEDALSYVVAAIEDAGFVPGTDVDLALDVAASEFFDGDSGTYVLAGEGVTFTSEELIDYYADLALRYPIASIEDGLDENDWGGGRPSPLGSVPAFNLLVTIFS